MENRSPEIPDIPSMKKGDSIAGIFLVSDVKKKLKRNGDPFLTLSFMNRTGKIEGKVWNSVESVGSFLTSGKIYKIKAVVNEYLGKKELNIEGINVIDNSGELYKISDFLEPPSFDNDEMFNEMIQFIKERTSSDYILQLTDLFCKHYGKRFKTHYGAQRIHHAYPGGLLKHTFSIIKLADSISKLYEVDNDILIPGALFHDIGKIEEFRTYPSVEITKNGGLLGHLLISVRILDELTSKITGFPEDLLLKIKHLVISHHGEKEFGSPEVPKTKEALILHLADLLDSKMDIFAKNIGSDELEGDFTNYIPTIGRRLLKD